MKNTSIVNLPAMPYFDMEDFMNFSRETRLESKTVKILLDYWQAWSKFLKVMKLENGADSWLAVWLPEEVEQKIDVTWDEAPSSGYLLNSLAQYLCMEAVKEVIPQISASGCAPSPISTPQLKDAIIKAGLDILPDTDSIARRYVIITNYPFKGGCEICNLKNECPKGKENFSTVVLPGFEKGKD